MKMTVFILVGIIIFIFQDIKVYSQSESANIDSLFSYVNGIWYKVVVYDGLTGGKDSVYSDEVNKIERITGTDSLIWTVSKNDTLKAALKYRLAYSKSFVFNENRWMFMDNDVRLLIEADSNSMTCGFDTYDGGGVDYSRKKSVSGITLADNAKVLCYPNSVESVFFISGISEIEYVCFFDIDGRLLQTIAPALNGSFDISGLKKGLYFVQVVSKGLVRTYKIIKNRSSNQ